MVTVAVIVLAVLLSIDPIAQDPAYYNFVDGRTGLAFRMPGTCLSNAGFLIVVILRFAPYQQRQHEMSLHVYVTLFMVGVFLTAFGSAWFHWNPNGHPGVGQATNDDCVQQFLFECLA